MSENRIEQFARVFHAQHLQMLKYREKFRHDEEPADQREGRKLRQRRNAPKFVVDIPDDQYEDEHRDFTHHPDSANPAVQFPLCVCTQQSERDIGDHHDQQCFQHREHWRIHHFASISISTAFPCGFLSWYSMTAERPPCLVVTTPHTKGTFISRACS